MLTYVLHHFDIVVRYVLSFLLIFYQIIVTARNKIHVGKHNLGILRKRKYFKGVYIQKDKVKETIWLYESYNHLLLK